MSKIIPAKMIDVGKFSALYFGSKPPRLETAVTFDNQMLSQKLIFLIMDITWKHGFGCSAPRFKEEGDLIFSIGTILPSVKSLPKYTNKLEACLIEVADFSIDFTKQFDFSHIDISMFADLDPNIFDLALIAAVRDQQYKGSWDDFSQNMKNKGRLEEVEVIEKCKEFEKINNKDIGLISSKLSDLLNTVSNSDVFGKN